MEIKTVSYVHVGDQLVNTDDLSREQKKELATWLKVTYLNTLYQGKAVCRVKDAEDEKTS